MKKFSEKNKDAFKHLFNCFIGTFGIKEAKREKFTLVKTIEEASYLSVKYNKLPFKDNENDLYEVKESQTFIKNDSYVPLFNQVLDLEAVELYKMSEIITNLNGIPTYYNTDQVVGNFRSQDDIDRMTKYIELEHWDEDLTLPKYKLDDKVTEKNFREPEINEEDYNIEVKEWNIIDDNGFMGKEETKKYAKYLIDNYGSFNLNGKATLLNAIVEYLEEQKKNVILH